MMRVLIGCETSGKSRRAFAALGHEAWSCDLLPADDGSHMHLQCDVRAALRLWQWDLFIVHPTCRYLSSSGLHWNARDPSREALTVEAVAFAVEMAETPHADKVVMENPIGCLSTRYRKPDQIIQPYQFGHDASKATCLWLRGVPPLVIDPALYFPPRLVCLECKAVFVYGMHKCPACRSHRYLPRWGNQTDSGQNKLPPSDDRWKVRSETYQGLADAFAANWGVA